MPSRGTCIPPGAFTQIRVVPADMYDLFGAIAFFKEQLIGMFLEPLYSSFFSIYTNVYVVGFTCGNLAGGKQGFHPLFHPHHGNSVVVDRAPGNESVQFGAKFFHL
ncbi:hypothetical protein SDC9_144908 [bioreactor metagenome]|uniref:Uncharacterized protein n=1 Tax=bioreactor metagenome TaxID=1076179 RepID=A0A645E8I3_9ZZZZ